MKILIDECAPKKLQSVLATNGYDCTTVQEVGWSGKTNGELLDEADVSFDVLVTGRSEYSLSAEPDRAQDCGDNCACSFQSAC